MAYRSAHYSTETSGDFKTFVDHFKRQAQGSDKAVFINNKPNMTSFGNTRANKSSLILVGLNKEIGSSKEGYPIAKVEVVDPSEGIRRRALSEAIRDENELTRTTDQCGNHHSMPAPRKRKTSAVKKSKQVQNVVN